MRLDRKEWRVKFFKCYILSIKDDKVIIVGKNLKIFPHERGPMTKSAYWDKFWGNVIRACVEEPQNTQQVGGGAGRGMLHYFIHMRSTPYECSALFLWNHFCTNGKTVKQIQVNRNERSISKWYLWISRNVWLYPFKNMNQI